MADLQGKLNQAIKLIESKQHASAIPLLLEVANASVPKSDENLKAKEGALTNLVQAYKATKQAKELTSLVEHAKPIVADMSQAVASKIIRLIVDALYDLPGQGDTVIALCKDNIAWAEKHNNVSLRHRLESKLALAHYTNKQYQEALTDISKLLREIKRLDDKPLLVEIFLLESRIQHSLNHLPKARAALTGSRTAATAIYCPPLLQADLDVQSGTLHCDEKDYKPAYSYFYEAFENYQQSNDDRYITCLKYMLLCKIMTNEIDDVQALLNGKLALRYATPEMEAMRAVAKAQANSSLKDFQHAMNTYTKDLKGNSLINVHLSQLYDTLLEKNLLKIIEPFSQVEIAHVAELIELSQLQVEKKLSQMILDKKLDGILDQGNGCLTVFDTPAPDSTYTSVIHTIGQFDKVVSSLYNRATKLSV